MRSLAFLPVATLVALSACTDTAATTAPDVHLSAAATHRGNDRGGAVYVLSNDARANAVLVFPRGSDGQLGAPASIPTGGRGTGGGLGNQYGLVLDEDGEMLLGVDAGSNEISAFRVDGTGLRQTARVASGGTTPVSVTVHDDLVYVLNDGTTANISGFRLDGRGQLTPIANSTRPRSAPAGAIDGAEVKFSPDGRTLVVTEKAANRIVSYPVLRDGRTGEPTVVPSSGPTPFGFDFTKGGTMVVSEAAGGAAGASTVSSYDVDRRSAVRLVSASVATGQSAVCWISITADGRTAYATNAGSKTVSSFAIGRGGALTLLDGAAGRTGAASAPSDMALSRGDRFLYVRSGADNTITVFATGQAGALAPVATVTGLPAGANGIAAR